MLAPDDHCAPDMFPHAVGPALAELGQGTLRSYVESKGCGAGHDLIISGHVIECGRHQEIVLGQFDLGWVRVANPGVPIAVAEIVAVEVHAFGLWSVNLSRIMQTIESATQFGFLYATTAHHAEQGEERFLIEYDPAEDGVWYRLEAVSRPRHPLARLAYPLTRRYQHRFARDSHRRMRVALGGHAL